MNHINFSNKILNNFPYKPTDSQEKLISILSKFLLDKNDKTIFVLKGYAGTGKTTVVSSIVNNLNYIGKNQYFLLQQGGLQKYCQHIRVKKLLQFIKRYISFQLIKMDW